MGDLSCPVNMHKAKKIWDLIKEEMDISDREHGGDDHVGVDQGSAPCLSQIEDGNENDGSEMDQNEGDEKYMVSRVRGEDCDVGDCTP